MEINVDQMQAADIHTVEVFRSEIAGWLVYEGKEDVNYTSLTYSPEDLTKFNPEELYQKPTEKDVLNLLKSVDLI